MDLGFRVWGLGFRGWEVTPHLPKLGPVETKERNGEPSGDSTQPSSEASTMKNFLEVPRNSLNPKPLKPLKPHWAQVQILDHEGESGTFVGKRLGVSMPLRRLLEFARFFGGLDCCEDVGGTTLTTQKDGPSYRTGLPSSTLHTPTWPFMSVVLFRSSQPQTLG